MLRVFSLYLLTVLCCILPGVSSAAVSHDLSTYVADDGVVYADSNIIKTAFSGPRNYTVAMLLTTEGGRVDCQFCKIIGPNFRTLASSYYAKHSSVDRDLYFVLADVDKNIETFKTLGLTHVPNLVFYRPTKSNGEAKQGLHGPHEFATFATANEQVEYLQAMFRKQGFDIEIIKPFPWDRFIKFVSTVALVAAASFFFRAQIVKVWQAKQIWLAFSIMSVVMFISGHMFNVTRGTPFMGYDGAGINLIERNFNSQLAVETQIVATIYAILAFTTFGLIKFVPKLKTAKAQTAGAIFGAAIILFAYSVLLETFKMKSGSFPLQLLPIKLF